VTNEDLRILEMLYVG